MKDYQCKSSYDGNRFNNETRDCTVRAISNAFEVPYEVAHKFMSKNGRIAKHGVPFNTVIGRKPRVIFGKRIAYHKAPHKTVGTFIKKHPTGTYIIAIAHHVFVLKDGVVIDLMKHNPNQHVKSYYYISNRKTNETDNQNKPECVDNTETVLQDSQAVKTECSELNQQRQSGILVY